MTDQDQGNQPTPEEPVAQQARVEQHGLAVGLPATLPDEEGVEHQGAAQDDPDHR